MQAALAPVGLFVQAVPAEDAAEQAEDFDLKEQFSELALEEAYHAALLRKIVERM